MGGIAFIVIVAAQIAGVYWGGRKMLFWIWLAEIASVVIYHNFFTPPAATESEVSAANGIFLFVVVLITLSAVAIAAVHFFALKYRARVQIGV
jgi:hypothetical protein